MNNSGMKSQGEKSQEGEVDLRVRYATQLETLKSIGLDD